MAKVLDIYRGRDPRELPLYTIAQAGMYLGVPASTLRTWTRGMDYPRAQGRRGRFEPLIHVADDTPVRLTFNNLIEAYVLKTIRRAHQVDLKVIRRAIANITRNLDEERPLLSTEFLTDGARLYTEAADEPPLDVSSDDGLQYAIREVIAIGLTRVDRDRHGIRKLYPFAENVDEPRAVAIDPRIRFGRPVIDGTGVSVAVVADMIKAGERPERVAKDFHISQQKLEEAVSWQMRAAA